MNARTRIAVAAVLTATLLSAADSNAGLTTVRVASGLDLPLYVTAPPGDTTRLFVVEQHSGNILVVHLADDTLVEKPFLTIPGVTQGDEQGLLGLAFHPDYQTNGFFYVNLTNGSGDTEIRRYHVTADPEVADPQSAKLLLRFDQPQENHNGGWIGFGPDELLYISSGDGGGSSDNDEGHTEGTGNGQDITGNLLGKILRIDVDGDDFPADPDRNYAIPPGNPFVGKTGDDEIWAFGLRNPWRASFDRLTGDFYIGDVGQSSREEIDVQPAGSDGGENYGWRLREGTISTPTVGGARPADAIDPIYNYTRGSGDFQGFVVTGGYVYRGPIASLRGHYLFADFASEGIWSLVWDGSDPADFDGTNFSQLTDRTAELDPPGSLSINQIASFGEDAAGNVYIVDHGGEVFRIESTDLTTTTTTTTSSTTTLGPLPACGDPVPPFESVTAGDALFVLRASVGTAECSACVCDVNDNADVTASDALAVLRAAVGQSVNLACPGC